MKCMLFLLAGTSGTVLLIPKVEWLPRPNLQLPIRLPLPLPGMCTCAHPTVCEGQTLSVILWALDTMDAPHLLYLQASSVSCAFRLALVMVLKEDRAWFGTNLATILYSADEDSECVSDLDSADISAPSAELRIQLQFLLRQPLPVHPLLSLLHP